MSPPSLKLNISHKLLIITALGLAGMLFTLFLFYQGLSSSLIQEKIFQTQRISDAGLSVIKHHYNLAKAKELSQADAQAKALAVLKSTTFGENGYFWVNDTVGILLMHPYSHELVNKDLTNTVDINGSHMFRNFITTAKSGGGLVDYYWQKPSTTETFPKKSYVVSFEPWGWVLGTGLYLDDMQKAIQKHAISALSLVFVFTIILVSFSIISTKKIMCQLEEIAIRDPLTLLHTRRYLNDHMERLVLCHEREQEKYLTVVFFDIDNFKTVNDTYGHSIGDEVLVKVSNIIKNMSRPDDLCIRFGGEEFIVILFSKNKDSALQYAERVRTEVNKLRFSSKDTEFSVSLSAGISIREKDEDFTNTIQRADQKLYKAKAQGRNCVVT